MPILPPACVTDMTEFRTVAGRSTTASLPWPRASKPTQSTAHSTSGIPTIRSDPSPRLRDGHDRVQDRRGPFHYGFFAVAARLKAHAIDRALHFWNSDDLLNLLGKHGVFPQVDDLAAEAFCLRQPLGNHVADDHARRAEQLAAGCAG